MKLYFATWMMPGSTRPAGDIIGIHPLIYERQNHDLDCDLNIQWWKELTHEEILLLNEGEAIDLELFNRYLDACNEGKVLCGECEAICEEKTGRDVYPHRRDLYDLKFFVCPKCGARCGTHKQTGKPLGVPVGPETRRARQDAHRAFDRLWKDNGPMTRSQAYKWLAKEMGLNKDQCHIGRMSEAQAETAEDLSYAHLAYLRDGRRPPPSRDGDDDEPQHYYEDDPTDDVPF